MGHALPAGDLKCKRFTCPADPTFQGREGRRSTREAENKQGNKKEAISPRIVFALLFTFGNRTPNIRKSSPRDSTMSPRRLQNRSQIASKWLPDNWILFCSFCSPLGRLLGRSWRLLGLSWRLLGHSQALPGRSLDPFWPPGGIFGELFGSLFGAPWENSPNLEKRCFSSVF